MTNDERSEALEKANAVLKKELDGKEGSYMVVVFNENGLALKSSTTSYEETLVLATRIAFSLAAEQMLSLKEAINDTSGEVN